MFYNNLTPEKIADIIASINEWEDKPLGYSCSDKLARVLIENWHADTVADNLELFHNLSSDVWVDLVNEWYEDCIELPDDDSVSNNWRAFKKSDRSKIRSAMNRKAYEEGLFGDDNTITRTSFDIDEAKDNEFPYKLFEDPLILWDCEKYIKSWDAMYVIDNLDRVDESDINEVVKMLCDAWFKEDLERERWDLSEYEIDEEDEEDEGYGEDEENENKNLME